MKKLLFLGISLLISTSVMAEEGPWRYGVTAYDINGEPYTGTAYLMQGAVTKAEFEDGIKQSELIDLCLDDQCMQEIDGYERRVLSVTKDGIPLEGLLEERPETIESAGGMKMTRRHTKGRYINGVPDGLHQEFDENDKVVLEKMMDKGRYVWTKEYSHDNFSDVDVINETLYEEGGIITKRKYENNKLVREEKLLFDGRKGYIAWYKDGKIAAVQEFKSDGTSVYKNYVTKETIPMEAYKIHDGSDDEDGPHKRSIVAGKREVCWVIYPKSDNILGELEGCSPSFDATMNAFQNFGQGGVKLTPEQRKELRTNPKAFFEKNELGLDLSDIGDLNLRQANADLEKKMEALMKSMMGAMANSMGDMMNQMLGNMQDAMENAEPNPAEIAIPESKHVSVEEVTD